MRRIVMIGTVFCLVFAAASAATATSGSITLDFTVVRDTPGSVHELYNGPMPIVGEECEVTTANANNNESIHIGNNLTLQTNGGTVNFLDVERGQNVTTPGDATVVPGENGVVTLTLGEDGLFSADLTLQFDCEPIETGSVEIEATCDRVTVTNNSDETVTIGHFDVQDSGLDVDPGETASMPGEPGVRWFVIRTAGQFPENLIQEGVYEECPDTTTTMPTETSSTTTIQTTSTTSPISSSTTIITSTLPAPTTSAPSLTVLPFTGIKDWLPHLGLSLLAAGLLIVLATRRTDG